MTDDQTPQPPDSPITLEPPVSDVPAPSAPPPVSPDPVPSSPVVPTPDPIASSFSSGDISTKEEVTPPPVEPDPPVPSHIPSVSSAKEGLLPKEHGSSGQQESLVVPPKTPPPPPPAPSKGPPPKFRSSKNGRNVGILVALLFLLVTSGFVYVFVNQKSSVNDIRNRAAYPTDACAAVCSGIGGIPQAVCDSCRANNPTGTVAPTGGCFLPGTLVQTPQGDVAIEKIKTGDSVYSFNPQTGKVSTGVVDHLFSLVNDHYYDLTLDNGVTLHVTGRHPMYRGEGYQSSYPDELTGEKQYAGFEAVSHLRVGDVLYQENVSETGERILVQTKVVTLKKIPGSVRVYNLEVTGQNTYFAEGIAVHNKPQLAPTSIPVPTVNPNPPRPNEFGWCGGCNPPRPATAADWALRGADAPFISGTYIAPNGQRFVVGIATSYNAAAAYNAGNNGILQGQIGMASANIDPATGYLRTIRWPTAAELAAALPGQTWVPGGVGCVTEEQIHDTSSPHYCQDWHWTTCLLGGGVNGVGCNVTTADVNPPGCTGNNCGGETPNPTPPGSTSTPTQTPTSTPTGSPTMTPTETPTGTPSVTPTPTATPTPVVGCNSTCSVNSDCSSGLICSDSKCRNSQCLTQTTCICAPPPITNLSTCNLGCTVNADCAGGLVCLDNFCRNASCSEKTTCQCDIAAGPTPKTPVAGTGPSILGATTIAGGFFLILLGLLF